MIDKKNKELNIDDATVAGFGDEWSRFTQDGDGLDEATRAVMYNDYFEIFPWEKISSDANGADIGCGSGRWAQIVAPLVGHLNLIDASASALSVAQCNLANISNVSFQEASVGSLPIDDGTMDFAYSLGVLHHVPDTAGALREIAKKLKPGAPFLVYLYYAFDNRSSAYRALWRISNGVRRIVSSLPHSLRYPVSQALAALVYWPLARFALVLDRFGMLPANWPLSYYRDKPFYVLRTDALDRFGTRLEKRFTKAEITKMLEDAGFVDIQFSDHAPYWSAVAIKA